MRTGTILVAAALINILGAFCAFCPAALAASAVVQDGAPGSHHRADTLRFATEGAFRPFNYFEGDELKGFEVDLGNAIAKKMGLKTHWTTRPFDALLPGLMAGHYAIVAASHAITPERALQVEFISPHYCTGAILVTKKGVTGTLASLADKTIGAAAGTTYFDRLKGMTRFKDVKSYPDADEAIRALRAGEVDAWVTDRFVANALVASPKGADLDIGELIFPEMIAMAVRKGDTKLRDRVDTALNALMQDGTYETISRRYFHIDIRCRNLGRRARSGAAGD